LTAGLHVGRDVPYLSTASGTQTAALANATYASNLAVAPQESSDDSASSAREAIIPIAAARPTGTAVTRR